MYTVGAHGACGLSRAPEVGSANAIAHQCPCQVSKEIEGLEPGRLLLASVASSGVIQHVSYFKLVVKESLSIVYFLKTTE